tara:strand:- start:1304 stop:1816 length:513 start_codon:yes stop_codon:yes gene_type:complete
MEIWRDVKGFEGIYQVSNYGRVKSLDKEVRNNRATFIRKGRILKPAPNTKGYLTVVLCDKGNNKTFKIHKLVAIAFLNHKPCGMDEVIDHINEDKTDNRSWNLRKTSNRENLSRSYKNASSKYTGVSWIKNRNKWKACIHLNGKNYHLGNYDNEYEASKAYKNALKNGVT